MNTNNSVEQQIHNFFDFVIYGKLVELSVIAQIWQVSIGWW
jgi:hypothetical protein